MIFNSFAFAVFLPVVFVVYWLLPQRTPRLQNLFLIGAGCFFYGWWDYRFLSLLFISSFVDYLAGCLMEHQESPLKRKLLVTASLSTNLGILGLFKYYGFFAQNFAELLTKLGVHADLMTLNIILPIGLSFYTFQSMAYTIDVYRRQFKPCRNFIDFFAFVSFFPQLVAGPIQRAHDLLPQFQRCRALNLSEVREGGEQVLWGLFKKVVIADNLAGPVEQIFHRHDGLATPTLFCGMLFFAVQIYCDFSGYSDIAIGTARFFGITLTRNFAYPYFSQNLVDFWHRWHISLSTWFRDYVYIPLGGNRVGRMRHYVNLFATFAISGLWHGANWTFIAWGIFHGALYVGYLLWRGKHTPAPDSGAWIPSVRRLLSMGLTFFVVLISWVFFRSQSIGDAFDYLYRFFTCLSGAKDFIDRPVLFYGLFLSGGLLLIEWLRRTKLTVLELGNAPRIFRWAVYYAVIALIFWFGNFHYVPFIYFAF